MWYAFLKPNKKSVIATVITLILWFALLFLLFGNSKQCFPCVYIPENACDSWPTIISTCDCCFTANDFFGQLFGFIIIPIIVIYLFYSSIFFMFNRIKL